jgi:hypothetical protein
VSLENAIDVTEQQQQQEAASSGYLVTRRVSNTNSKNRQGSNNFGNSEDNNGTTTNTNRNLATSLFNAVETGGGGSKGSGRGSVSGADSSSSSVPISTTQAARAAAMPGVGAGTAATKARLVNSNRGSMVGGDLQPVLAQTNRSVFDHEQSELDRDPEIAEANNKPDLFQPIDFPIDFTNDHVRIVGACREGEIHLKEKRKHTMQ